MRNVGSLEDRTLIRELCEQYCDGVFRKDPRLWGDTWAEDAKWFHSNKTTKGRQAIIDEWLETMSAIEACGFFCMPGGIEIDGDTAIGRCYHSETMQIGGKLVRGVSYYDDKYIKKNGKWYFLERILTTVQRS